MPRILVVDDQKDVRAMICMVLRVNHFEVGEAESAKTGLKAFAEESFDAAMVDIFLEDTNGFDLIAAMRERVPNLPVVAVSGMTTLDFRGAIARAVQHRGLSAKPFRPVELILRARGRPGIGRAGRRRAAAG